MSEDGFSDSSDEPNMEIQIETLMGSSFDMRVSATDTIQDIKRRIHRVEGIPVTHQNLIFQSKELSDCRKLQDVGIKDGSRLKLVLSMRGGPISTRRIATACEHQMMLKQLKELLDTTGDEIGDRLTPGSKVSVLVFREGDIYNLLRVIENEDGSYVPYSEKPISPPTRSHANRVEIRSALFEKLMEDNKMMSNVTALRKRMEDAARRRRIRINEGRDHGFADLLGESCEGHSNELRGFGVSGGGYADLLDRIDLSIFEQRECDDEKEEGNQSESEEIALKDSYFSPSSFVVRFRRWRLVHEGCLVALRNASLSSTVRITWENDVYDKHRSKQIRSPRPTVASVSSKSLYSESKGSHSHTKNFYARMHKKTRDGKHAAAREESVSSDGLLAATAAPLLTPLCPDDDTIESKIDETVAPSAALVEGMTVTKGLRVARLVISDDRERPKATTEAIEVEEPRSDLWSIRDAQPRQRLKSATYKLGVLKRRQSMNYGIDESPQKVPQEMADFNYTKSSSYEVCSSSNFYHMQPPFMASPSAIPPQYAPKNQDICDYFHRNRPRSPLYGRKSSRDGRTSCDSEKGASSRISDDLNKYSKLPDIVRTDTRSESRPDTGPETFTADFAGIQRLKNDRLLQNGDLLFAEGGGAIDELCSYYSLGGAGDFLGDAKFLDADKSGENIELPPVIKKRARCNFCNRKLNITNIYNCRCGKIFCSQHRYSEVHHCNYDYKTDGRRFLEQQNPLVTADKINRF